MPGNGVNELISRVAAAQRPKHVLCRRYAAEDGIGLVTGGCAALHHPAIHRSSLRDCIACSYAASDLDTHFVTMHELHPAGSKVLTLDRPWL